MEALAEKRVERIGERQGVHGANHDLVEELHDRLNRLWHYGECLANAEGDPEAQKQWRDLQRQELASIIQLRLLILSRIEQGEFFEEL